MASTSLKKKGPGGAPSLYKPEYCQKLIDHMSSGLTIESFAAVIDVSKETVYNWMRDIPEFSDAGERAKAKARLFWESKGIDGMNGKIRNFNSGVWQFWMKNRFKWHDNVQIQQDTKLEVKQDTSEAKRLLTEAIKASLEVK